MSEPVATLGRIRRWFMTPQRITGPMLQKYIDELTASEKADSSLGGRGNPGGDPVRSGGEGRFDSGYCDPLPPIHLSPREVTDE